MNLPYDPKLSLDAWSRIPVEDLDYFTADELLLLRPEQLGELIALAGSHRWNPNEWRNQEHKLFQFMSPGSAQGKVVMDFGCGLGLDTVQFALHGAQVILADIHPKTLALAQKALVLSTGLIPTRLCLVSPDPPFFFSQKLDVFWSMGVLHHTPHIQGILRQVVSHLKPEGEARICLYSDKRWQQMIGEPLPEKTWEHPRFLEFARRCDAVGHWADAYSPEKLERLVEDFAKVERCDYLCDGQFLGGVIKAK